MTQVLLRAIDRYCYGDDNSNAKFKALLISKKYNQTYSLWLSRSNFDQKYLKIANLGNTLQLCPYISIDFNYTNTIDKSLKKYITDDFYHVTVINFKPIKEFNKRHYGWFKNVTSIKGDFLCNRRRLTTINLSPLSNITSIRDGFLSGCCGLTTIDLSHLPNITSIGNNFLCGC